MGRPKTIKKDNYFPTEEETKAMSWCIDKRIKVYPEPEGDEYRLVLEYPDNGKIQKVKSPDLYPKHNWTRKLYELYAHMYKKNVERF